MLDTYRYNENIHGRKQIVQRKKTPVHRLEERLDLLTQERYGGI